MALLGFTSTHINEKIVCDFYEDLLRNWITHVPPATKGEYMNNAIPLTAIPLAHHDEISEPKTGDT